MKRIYLALVVVAAAVGVPRAAIGAPISYEVVWDKYQLGPQTTTIPLLTFTFDEKTELFGDFLVEWKGVSNFKGQDVTEYANLPCEKPGAYQTNCSQQGPLALFAIMSGGGFSLGLNSLPAERDLTIAALDATSPAFWYQGSGFGFVDTTLARTINGTAHIEKTPEPSALMLIGTGLIGLGYRRRRVGVAAR